MKLLDLIVKEAIDPNLEATTRDEAIGLLIDKLIDAKVLDKAQRDDFIKAIIKRERRGSTGFGHGVAVPHVKHPEIETLTAAVGVCKDGIDFNALDGQPVHSIFLIISPEQKPEEHPPGAHREVEASRHRQHSRCSQHIPQIVDVDRQGRVQRVQLEQY